MSTFRRGISAVYTFHVDAGHRVLGDEGPCGGAHGHSYRIDVHIRPSASFIGRVIDPAVIRERLGGWLARFWDHAFIVSEVDTALVRGIAEGGSSRVFMLPAAPTPENLAFYFLRVCEKLLSKHDASPFRVVVWQSADCCAEATVDVPVTAVAVPVELDIDMGSYPSNDD